MASSEPSPARVQLLTALVILGTFIGGLAAGLGLSRWLREAERPPPPHMGLPLRELDLTPEQDTKARAIMERHRDELEGILRGTYPRVRAVNDKMENELRAILTPAQQAKLDEIKSRRPPPRDHGRGGPGGPGGPRGPGFGPPPGHEGMPPPAPPPP